MILYDISREIISAPSYPGDPSARLDFVKNIEDGDEFNLSALSMCSHSGTHIDAPLHFDEYGGAVSDMKLGTFYGKCTVVTVDGIVTGEQMDRILPKCKKRILFKGNSKSALCVSAADVIADSEAVLVGTDSMSIAADFDEAAVHKSLAGANIAILENLDLSAVSDGEYMLFAFPLKIEGAEAAPCRAVLLEQEKGFF